MRNFWMIMAWLMVGAMTHGGFVPPADGPVAFRRDQLPLDAATMAGISQRLVTMAEAQAMKTPEERRDAARMLALALALDPQNTTAGERVTAYRENPAARQAAQATAPDMAPVWRTIAWLEQPEAGAHGQALAVLLLDVAAVADPEHPRAKEADGGHGAWDGWVPPLAAYVAPARPPRTLKEPEEEKVAAKQLTDSPPLAAAAVRTVIWQKPAKAKTWEPAVASLHMRAVWHDGRADNTSFLRIGARDSGGGIGMDRLSRTISQLLQTRDEKVPGNLRVSITSPEYEAAAAARVPRPVSAAAAVLASAAVSGREPDALIIGEVDSSGQFTLPEDFWRILASLDADKGRKLVLPVAAMDWLPSLLALEKAEFFLDHEVLLARDFDQLVALSAKVPDEETAAAAALFADIRTRGQGGDIRDYLGNRFVRQRLAELSQQAPWHASAALLHTQSAGQRPVNLSRPVLAAELLMAIRPMAAIAAIAKREFIDSALTAEEAASLGGIHNACREKIDRLASVTTRNDQDLFQSARALAAALRSLERSARSTRGDEKDLQYANRREIRSFARLYDKLVTDLREEAGKGSGEDPR